MDVKRRILRRSNCWTSYGFATIGMERRRLQEGGNTAKRIRSRYETVTIINRCAICTLKLLPSSIVSLSRLSSSDQHQSMRYRHFLAVAIIHSRGRTGNVAGRKAWSMTEEFVGTYRATAKVSYIGEIIQLDEELKGANYLDGGNVGNGGRLPFRNRSETYLQTWRETARTLEAMCMFYASSRVKRGPARCGRY